MKKTYDYVHRKIQEVYVLENPDRLKEKNINFKSAAASFVDKHTIVINENGQESRITSKVFVIATGAEPAALDVEGIDSVKNKWDYQQIWEVQEIPERLAVIGAGPIVSSAFF